MRFSDFRMWAASWWAGTFGQTRLSRVGEGASTVDVVRMADPDSTSPEEVVELTRLEQFGDVVCPIPEANAIIWRKSDGGVAMSLGVPNLRPQNCKTGDRALYSSQAGTVVKLHGAASSAPGRIEARRADGASAAVTENGDVVLADKAGGSATLSNKVLTVRTDVVADTITAEHFAGRGGQPTVVAGPAVGAGVASIYPGSTDAALILSLVVSSGSPGKLASVTFARAYDRAPQGLPAPGALTPQAASPPAAGSFYFSSVSSSGLEISTTTTLPDGSYLLSFVVVR